MRQLFYTHQGVILDTNAPEPQLRTPTDVKIKVCYASICGSDLHTYKHELDHLFTAERNGLGHEMGGYVVELGPEATAKGLKIGDKVTYYYNQHCTKCWYCRNGQEQLCSSMKTNFNAMADYLVTDEQTVFKLDDDADLSRAVYVEPISVCLHGIDMCRIKAGQSVAIVGGGGIGLLLLQLARLSGATKLTLIEPIAAKREIAKQLGAMYTIDPFNEDQQQTALKITDGRLYDVVIEASGSVKACPGAYELVGRGGTLEFFAALYRHDYDFPLNLMNAFFKEITIVGGVFQSPYEFPRSTQLFKVMNLEPMMLPGSIFAPEDYEAAFNAQISGKTIKSIFKFE